MSSRQIQIPRFEAELILASLLKCNRTDLYLYRYEVSPLIEERFQSSLKRRSEGEPLQYILGSVEFCGLEFRIDRRVFIPRPETELLVEEVYNWLKDQGARFKVKRVLDIGTGCGNIAISIAKMMQDVEIVAVDISEEAIKVAKENAKLNGVFEKIEFLTGDMYEPFLETNIKFDCIVSNPPYIASGEIGTLEKEILREPRVALDGGLDGFLFIRRIIDNGFRFLKERGCIFLEIGYNQADRVAQILEKSNFKLLKIVKDYNGIERIVGARWINL